LLLNVGNGIIKLAVVGLGIVSAGSGVYSLSKQYKAGEIGSGEFVANIVTGGVIASASIGGAMAGGLAVKAITNYAVLNKAEKAVAERILNKQNSIKTTTKRGYLTETEIKNLKISSGERTELLRQYKMGNSIREVKVGLNKNVLSPAELKIANKLNFRGTGYQVTSSVGKSVTGASSYNIKTGRGIARFNSQMTREVTSLFLWKI